MPAGQSSACPSAKRSGSSTSEGFSAGADPDLWHRSWSNSIKRCALHLGQAGKSFPHLGPFGGSRATRLHVLLHSFFLRLFQRIYCCWKGARGRREQAGREASALTLEAALGTECLCPQPGSCAEQGSQPVQWKQHLNLMQLCIQPSAHPLHLPVVGANATQRKRCWRDGSWCSPTAGSQVPAPLGTPLAVIFVFCE